MNLAIIPARSGSKRIKNKNIVKVNNKPMIQYALDAAKKSKIFHKIHVSTDSKKIESIVNNLGYEIDFLRPKHLADDFTGIIPVLKHVLEIYKKDFGLNFKNIFCIFPAAPLLKKQHLVDAFKLYKKYKFKKPLHVISEYDAPIQWAFSVNKNNILIPREPGMFSSRSQDLKKYYYECGPFSIFNSRHIMKNVSDKNFIGFKMPKYSSIDVDTLEDLNFVRKILKI